jgi:hypothetical protein
MLAVPFHPQVEALQARPVVGVNANAWDCGRGSHAGSAAQDVVGGIKAEIIAEPEIMAAEPEMEVVAAGAANPSRETKAHRSAAATKADGARPTAKAVAHASVAAAPAASGAKTNAVTAAAAKAKTNAVTAASTAHGGVGLRRCSEREGKGCQARQK